jgi:bacillithiol biosynthesis cysteine-adding enzyme BshC
MSRDATIAEAAGIVRATVGLSRLPWIRPLVTAYTTDFESVAPLFAGNPADPDAWLSAVARVRRRPRDRATLAAAVRAQLDARGAPEQARTAARRLADDTAVAVVTGQQAGLFGGPLYTLLKAVTTIQVARRLETEHGVPTVPVFWVESEDHDWQEVRTATLLDKDLVPKTVTVADPPGGGRQPVGSLCFDDSITGVLDEVRSVLPETEFTSELLSTVARAYRPGAYVGAAFATLLDSLLGPHGLVVFEAGDPAAKPLVADIFAAELEHSGRTAALVREAGDNLARRGHEPQVRPADDGVALFYVDDAGRRPIKRRSDGLGVSDAVRSVAAWVEEATAHPERFSPNVVLRPIVQDRLFPTVCYVAGPSELAYQAQLGGVYRAFDVEPPLLWPRASATIADPATARFLSRYDVSLDTLAGDDDAGLNRLLEAQLPPDVETAIDDTRREITKRADDIKRVVTVVDPTLAGAVDTTRDRMHDTLKKLQNKIVQAAKRKDDTLRRQFTHARALAFPNGSPQERTAGMLVFINRYGPALVDRLIEGLPAGPASHYLLVP